MIGTYAAPNGFVAVSSNSTTARFVPVPLSPFTNAFAASFTFVTYVALFVIELDSSRTRHHIHGTTRAGQIRDSRSEARSPD